jgi:hypothetical protein
MKPTLTLSAEIDRFEFWKIKLRKLGKVKLMVIWEKIGPVRTARMSDSPI